MKITGNTTLSTVVEGQGAEFQRGAHTHHPGGNPWANLKSISNRCHPILVVFVWELTKETIILPLGCLYGGFRSHWFEAKARSWRDKELSFNGERTLIECRETKL